MYLVFTEYKVRWQTMFLKIFKAFRGFMILKSLQPPSSRSRTRITPTIRTDVCIVVDSELRNQSALHWHRMDALSINLSSVTCLRDWILPLGLAFLSLENKLERDFTAPRTSEEIQGEIMWTHYWEFSWICWSVFPEFRPAAKWGENLFRLKAWTWPSCRSFFKEAQERLASIFFSPIRALLKSLVKWLISGRV